MIHLQKRMKMTEKNYELSEKEIIESSLRIGKKIFNKLRKYIDEEMTYLISKNDAIHTNDFLLIVVNFMHQFDENIVRYMEALLFETHKLRINKKEIIDCHIDGLKEISNMLSTENKKLN